MASSLPSLARRWRRNAASAAFLALVFVFFFLSVTMRRHDRDDGEVDFVFTSAGARALASSSSGGEGSCQELRKLEGHGARCRYLRSHPPCTPSGYVDYLRVFYCGFGWAPWLGYAVLALWLVVLFYLLGDTASEYFCASLEGLSAALRLPPAIAGVTLLSLGNGAPDVLSSIVAFAGDGDGGDDAGDLGLSSVLGGALFVSTVVAGVVAIVAGRRGDDDDIVIERRGFVRDVCFLLVALGYLLAVLLAGTVTVWVAASFLSLYGAYVVVVWTSHCCATAAASPPSPDKDTTTKPTASALLAAPLLIDDDAPPPPILPVSSKPDTATTTIGSRLLAMLHAPLYLPRRLTIPDIAAHRWSRPYAVASALLSPLLLAAISFPTTTSLLLAAALLGAALAAVAAITTSPSAPPSTHWARVPWLAGGFLMSVLWSYVVARELVALLVSAGVIAGVGASVLGVTVLAWGNSLGDLVADVALAMHGGAQTAVAGCYAGPAFNTVVGLGLALTLAAGARFPEPYAIPVEGAVYVNMGFLAAALVWAAVVLPVRGMRLDRVLGVGLLLIYLAFLCTRLSSTLNLTLSPKPLA